MTTSHTHVRASKRPLVSGKHVRPALIQRHSHPKPCHRPNSSRAKTEITVEEEHVEEDAMSATFPQFCAVCDKQIMIPSSVLYCSESCRKQDAHDSVSYAIFKSDAAPRNSPQAISQPTSSQGHNIIPQPSPSQSYRHPFDHSRSSSEASVSDTENTSSSLHERQKRPSQGRRDSEAARYLAQFQSSNTPSTGSRDSKSGGTTTPGLSLTPTSTTSASMPFTPLSHAASRVQSPFHSNRWSVSSFTTRSDDLVIPIAHCTTAPSSLTTITDKGTHTSLDGPSVGTPRASEQLSYEKRSPVPGSAMSPGQSSLKQLFRFDSMRAAPSAEEA